jgi:hypothetical protein
MMKDWCSGAVGTVQRRADNLFSTMQIVSETAEDVSNVYPLVPIHIKNIDLILDGSIMDLFSQAQ